jgi:hypothetical protein
MLFPSGEVNPKSEPEVWRYDGIYGYSKSSAPGLQSRSLRVRLGLRKCKTPLLKSGVCKSTRSRKGRFFMSFPMLLLLLLLLRKRRTKFNFQIHLDL